MSVKQIAFIFIPIGIIGLLLTIFIIPTLKERKEKAKDYEEQVDYEWRIIDSVASLFVIIIGIIVMIWLAIFHGDSN